MTKPRTPRTFEEAAQRAMGILGARDMGAVVGKSAKLMHLWTDEDADSLPSIRQAFLVDKACDEQAGITPFQTLYETQLHEAEVGRGDHGACVRHVMGQVGDLTKLYDEAMRDGRLSPEERRHLVRACHQAIERIHALLSAIEPAHEAENVEPLTRPAAE